MPRSPVEGQSVNHRLKGTAASSDTGGGRLVPAYERSTVKLRSHGTTRRSDRRSLRATALVAAALAVGVLLVVGSAGATVGVTSYTGTTLYLNNTASSTIGSSGRQLVTSAPWGRSQWERLAEGQVFDGMESWLPWLAEREHLLPDLLPDTALVLLVEPKRMRDRAQDLLNEEAQVFTQFLKSRKSA